MPKKDKEENKQQNKQELQTMPKQEVTIAPTGADAKVLTAFQEMQMKNEVAEVLKELFRDEKILMITDLNSDEIRLITRIRMIADMKDIKYWKDGLDLFMKLVLSRDRKSRKEILDAIRGYTQTGGFLSKLNPANWKR